MLFGCCGLQSAVAGSNTHATAIHRVHAADARGAAATPERPAQKALLAALEREAARRRQATAATATASSNAPGVSYRLASSGGRPPSESQQPTALKPDEVFGTRGLWDSATAEQAAELRAAAARQALPARVADEAQASSPHPPAETTIAEKRGPDQAVSTIVAAHSGPAAAAKEGTRFDNPWLDAVMISPSARRYLTVLTLGAPDYRTLAALVEKPARTVMMTFGADANPGMTNDRFSGSAIVFISTVTYQPRPAPDHTASLQ